MKIKLFPAFLGILTAFLLIAGIGQYKRGSKLQNDAQQNNINVIEVKTSKKDTSENKITSKVNKIWNPSKRGSFEIMVEDVEKKQGTFGIYIKNIDTKATYALNKNKLFFAASLYKVPVAVATYKAQENQALNFSDSIQYSPADFVGGTGSIVNNGYYKSYTIADLVSRLLKLSDNAAQNMLIRIIDKDSMAQAFTAYYESSNDNFYINQEITPQNMGDYFENLYLDSVLEVGNSNRIGYLTQKSSKELLSTMEQTSFDDRIHQGLPQNYTFSHKIGNWGDTGSWHDCGIAVGDEKYVLCLMSENTTYEQFIEVAILVGKFLE